MVAHQGQVPRVDGLSAEGTRSSAALDDSSRSHTSKKYLAKSSSEMGTEFILKRSRTAIRCGEINSPILLGVECVP